MNLVERCDDAIWHVPLVRAGDAPLEPDVGEGYALNTRRDEALIKETFPHRPRANNGDADGPFRRTTQHSLQII
jgi:hypothetical protein